MCHVDTFSTESSHSDPDLHSGKDYDQAARLFRASSTATHLIAIRTDQIDHTPADLAQARDTESVQVVFLGS